MQQLLPSLRRPPIGFAHRGARAHAPENTLDAFRLALRLGATGLESDVWLTVDGQPVLDHDGLVRLGRRKRPIGELARAELPAHIPTLDELYGAVGVDFELSLDLKDAAAAPAVIDAARRAGAAGRLWLCHPDWTAIAPLREAAPEVQLVDSTQLKLLRQGPERRAAQLAEAGFAAINLHHRDWTGGLVTLFHRFGVHAFAWDLQIPRLLITALRMGVDGVFSDHVDRMTDALGCYVAPPSELT